MDEQVDSRGRRRALVVAASATAAVAVVVALVLLAARDASPGAADPGGTVLPTVAGTGTAAPDGLAGASAGAGPQPSDAAAAGAGGEVPDGATGDAGGQAAGEAVPVPPVSDVAPVVVEGAGAARTPDGLSVSVTSVAPVDVTGEGPGEYAGPGMVVTVRVVNEGSGPVRLGSPAVSVYAGGGGLPVAPVPTDPGNVLLPAQVGAGESVEGAYRFAEPATAGVPLAVSVLLSPSAAPVVVQGLRLG